MTKKEIKVVAIIIIIMIITTGILFIKKNKNKNVNTINDKNITSNQEFVSVQEDGTKINKSNNLAQTKTIDGLEISNVVLIEKDGESYLQATVKNTTNKILGEEFIKLTLINKSGDTLSEVKGYLGTIPEGGTSTLNIKANADFANAYDFKVSK